MKISLASLHAEQARRNLATFARLAWPILEPVTPLVWGWHCEAICEHLDALASGEIRRLLVNIPPRSMKTSLISILWPIWSWLNHPSLRWLCASYSLALATRDNRSARLLIQSPWFQKQYGHLFHLSDDQNTKLHFENSARGYRLAVSVGSAITGSGGDILLLDDPHSTDEALSPQVRRATIQWFNETWSTRLNDPQHGGMVVVGQRIHENDLSGHLLDVGGWEHLKLPAEFEPASRCHTSLGWSDPRQEAGESLWPQRLPEQALKRLKRQLGSIAYSAQYQQTPAPLTGNFFRQEWFRYYTNLGEALCLETESKQQTILSSHCWSFATVDLAISSKQEADYTVIALWLVTPNRDLILTNLLRARLDSPGQQRQIELCFQRFHPLYFRIETVAYQLALVQSLLARGIPCKEYRPVRDKISRATTASVWLENGKLFFPRQASWLPDLEHELLHFPRSTHDDCVDALSMAAEEVSLTRRPGVFLLDEPETDLSQADRQFNPWLWDASDETGGLYV